MEKLAAESKSSSTLPPDHRAFLDAARTGDIERVRGLLAKGVPVDVREDFCTHYRQNEQTALMYAAGAGHLEIVRVLLKAGANVNAIDKMTSRESGGEQTALHYAAGQANVTVVEELLNAGCDPNALTKNAWNRGWTPLAFALRAGHREIAQLLVKRGTNLTSKIGRKQAYSPLCAALDAKRDGVPAETIRDFVLLLLDAGADPNGTGDLSATALFSLAGRDTDIQATVLSEEITTLLAEKLLQAGAKPDWPNKFGWVPLHTALSEQKAGMVKLLLEAGADVNRITPRGTAQDIAQADLANYEERLRELTASPAPADEQAAKRQKQLRDLFEDKLRQCKEIEETLRRFSAKRKSELSQPG